MDEKELKKIQSENMRLARIKASEYWKSPEGKIRRKELAHQYIQEKGQRKNLCPNCKIEFKYTSFSLKKYCSNKCKSAFRRKNKIDNVEGNCAICSKLFFYNSYTKNLTCSKKCLNKIRSTHGGEGHLTPCGYRWITREHPNSNNRKRIFEHTYIMSQYLERPLRKGESVHHKNGIRDDNHIENLELWHRGQPSGQRVEDKIKWAKEFLEEYGYEVKR